VVNITPQSRKSFSEGKPKNKTRGRNKKMVPPSLNVGQGVTLVYKEGQMIVLSHGGRFKVEEMSLF
jgi:hypothetical protein